MTCNALGIAVCQQTYLNSTPYTLLQNRVCVFHNVKFYEYLVRGMLSNADTFSIRALSAPECPFTDTRGSWSGKKLQMLQ